MVVGWVAGHSAATVVMLGMIQQFFTEESRERGLLTKNSYRDTNRILDRTGWRAITNDVLM